jgi:predicted kinase
MHQAIRLEVYGTLARSLDERQTASMRMIVVAGPPGSGKSTLARGLARRLDAPLFDKDRVREALFGPNHVEYSREQDDLVCAAIHAVVRGEARRREVLVLDGRTYSRREQVDALVAVADEIGAELHVFLCECSAKTAARRVAADRERGAHPAANRSPELARAIQEAFEPLALPHHVVDTDALDGDAAVEYALACLRNGNS